MKDHLLRGPWTVARARQLAAQTEKLKALNTCTLARAREALHRARNVRHAIAMMKAVAKLLRRPQR